MTHSVRRHLRLDIDEYDATIRRFIPGYETMLRLVAEEVAPMGPGLVLDLGAGTGALSEAILYSTEARAVEMIDVDPEMLERARARVARFRGRGRPRERSFHDPLPSCDAVVASLSLHHIPTMSEKRTLYGRIFDALWSGGIFVNADAVMPEDAEAREATFGVWADHMESQGIPRSRAFEHFEEWAEEDTYFPLEAEIDAMVGVGFAAECRWQEGPLAVVVGRKR